MTEENDIAALPLSPEEYQRRKAATLEQLPNCKDSLTSPEANEGRKPAILEQDGVPGFLASRRQGFSRSIKKFNKTHCNNRFGK